MRLKGRIALITGASRGLGAAAALAYAREGAHCVVVARTVGGLEALDDEIKAAGGRILPYWGAYAASKAALDMLVGVYAAECAHTNVRVNLYNPGPMRTAMRKEAFPGEDPQSLPPPEAHGEGLIQLALPSCTM